MPRRRLTKPWLHARSGYYCTYSEGKRVYLDRDYRVACRKLRDLKARQKRAEQPTSDWLEAPFAELADEFLDDLKARKKPSSYTSYRYRLRQALEVLGTELRVIEVRKHHLAQVERRYAPTHSPSTVKDTIAAVQTVFGWAVRHDMLDENPFVGYQKPAARIRTRIIEPTEFRALLRCSDPPFRRVLLSLALTGCRPVEVRSLRWDWVNLTDGFWILPDHKTITRQRHPRPRVIPLPEVIWKLCRWLDRSAHGPNDHVFLNCWGKPYGKDTLCRKMARVRKRAGIGMKGGESLVLYSTRHTFGTETSGAITDIELAELMGHTDTRTTRRYVHLNTARLREIQLRAHDRRLQRARGNARARPPVTIDDCGVGAA